jgi:superfamily I DNA/RNA helicase
LDLGHLNPPQREAVEYGTGPLLVLAGAGSGKTRVITHRIARLVHLGIPPGAIAAMTFTNRAAGEMRERVQRLLPRPGDAKKLTMGTFHALGLTVLRAERKALGFPRGFAIYDTSDQLGAVREIMRRIADDRRYDIKAILARISLAKNAFIAADRYEPAEGDEYDEITAEVYPAYEQALRSFAAVDFDDLITEPVRLFDREPEVRERWAGRFHHVLVDEFQDTNRAQLLFLKHLVAQHGNLCVVGDDDQSIYSWRGADPTNILTFADLFPGAHIVKLEQNYRSTPQILAAANEVIANNQDRHGKRLWSDRPPGPQLVTVVAENPEKEADFVCREIERLIEHGRRHADVAVLYRSNNQTRVLEEVFRDRQIPYAMFGGQQFYERKEVKDVIAYMRVALTERDEISLRRIINYPARGIGATTVQRLADYAHRKGISLWAALTSMDELGDEIKAGQRRAIGEFVAIIERLRARMQATAPEHAVQQLIADIGLTADLQAAAPSLSAAQRRIDNVSSFLRSLARYSARPDRPELMEYLRRLSLDTGSDDSPAEVRQRVTLTTLHGAKGLEFPVVFLVGAEEGLLPHARTLMPQVTDVANPEHAADISEERRLVYVGITRAEQLLYITRCRWRRSRGQAGERMPSRFLLEIPEELIEPRDLLAEAQAPVDPNELRAFFRSFGD